MNQTHTIRWLIRRDMPDVTSIEAQSYDCLMGEDGMVDFQRSRNAIGMVAEVDRQVVGFMLYELHKGHIRVVRLCVAKVCRNKGAGSAMIQRLIDKLAQQQRTDIVIEVPESAVTAQVWLRKREFRCIGTQANHYDNGEAMYLMRYSLKTHDDSVPTWDGVNRITEYLGE